MPEGDWFCNRCKPNQQPLPQKKQRQVYTEEEDELEEDEEEDEEDEEEESESEESTIEDFFEDSPYVFNGLL